MLLLLSEGNYTEYSAGIYYNRMQFVLSLQFVLFVTCLYEDQGREDEAGNVGNA